MFCQLAAGRLSVLRGLAGYLAIYPLVSGVGSSVPEKETWKIPPKARQKATTNYSTFSPQSAEERGKQMFDRCWMHVFLGGQQRCMRASTYAYDQSLLCIQ